MMLERWAKMRMDAKLCAEPQKKVEKRLNVWLKIEYNKQFSNIVVFFFNEKEILLVILNCSK